MTDVHLDAEYLAGLQAQAQAEERECVVGGLIINDAGHIFAQRRAPNRRWFPGSWDIAGGHVDGDETLLQALAREIEEETGWQLRRTLELIAVFDWETERGGEVIQKRGFDFIVEVSGDLDQPQLEAGKFTEYRWIDRASLSVLKENRAPDDSAIYDLAARVLDYSQSASR